jgi:DNA topoisomerase-3
MRSEIEKQLDLIARGESTLGPVVDHALDIFKAKFLYFVKNINEMDDLFEVSYSKMAEAGKPFSRLVLYITYYIHIFKVLNFFLNC